VLAVTAVGCTWQDGSPTAASMPLDVAETPDGFARVEAGGVGALIPPEWRTVDTTSADAARHGFVASPRPEAWGEAPRPVAGISATWVDATEVGVPSDYFYLAATGPLLSRLVASERCDTIRQRVYLDNAPMFASGHPRSTGDYVARGEGVCGSRGGRPTRWAYFVAAPGLGPVRRVGIPTSGLYVVVAVAPEGPQADGLLEHLMRHTRFGDATLSDFVRAARAARPA
jgi:hypothetical protein